MFHSPDWGKEEKVGTDKIMKLVVFNTSTFSSDYLHGHFLPIGIRKPQFCFRVSDKDGIPEKKSYIVQEADELALKQKVQNVTCLGLRGQPLAWTIPVAQRSCKPGLKSLLWGEKVLRAGGLN